MLTPIVAPIQFDAVYFLVTFNKKLFITLQYNLTEIAPLIILKSCSKFIEIFSTNLHNVLLNLI